jgi:peptidyl-dipeptidase A
VKRKIFLAAFFVAMRGAVLAESEPEKNPGGESYVSWCQGWGGIRVHLNEKADPGVTFDPPYFGVRDGVRVSEIVAALKTDRPSPAGRLYINGFWRDAVEACLQSLGAHLWPMQVDLSRETWKFYTTGEEGRMEEIQNDLIAAYSDREKFHTLKALRCFDRLNEDSVLKWRVERQYRAFLAYQGGRKLLEDISRLENNTHGILIAHRATLDGELKTNEELRDVLRFDPDRAKRERAWRALYGVGNDMVEGVRALARKRNELARGLGYPSYYEMRFEIDGLDLPEMEALLERLDSLSEEPYQIYLKKKTEEMDLKRLAPWDTAYDPEQIMEEMNRLFPAAEQVAHLKATYAGMGFDLAALGIVEDLEPRPNKSQHAYSFAIEPPGDVRILANISAGMDSAETLLHEFGHAVYSKHVPASPWDLREDAGGPMTEGMGQFFGRISEDPRWLRETAGAPSELVEKFIAKQHDRNIASLRYSLVMLQFERALYRNPEQDLGALWWRLMRRYLGVRAVPETASFGAIVHYTTHPVYLQNYLLADMICDMLWEHMENGRGGVVGNPSLAPYFVETFFRHGASYSWQELLRRSLGRPLEADPYLRHRIGN